MKNAFSHFFALILLLGMGSGLNLNAQAAQEKIEGLELWPYVKHSADQEQHERKIEGISFLIGGAAAVGFSFLSTSEGSPLRDVAMFTLVPAGFISAFYGSYELLTDSPRMKLKNRVEHLSGEESKDPQWRLRREANARQVLLEEGDNARFWRYFWGGTGVGTATAILVTNRSAPSVGVSAILLALASYQFFHKRADERLLDHLERLSVSLDSDRGYRVAYQFRF